MESGTAISKAAMMPEEGYVSNADATFAEVILAAR
jgi:hypothetical protein